MCTRRFRPRPRRDPRRKCARPRRDRDVGNCVRDCVQPLSSALSVTLPAFHAERRRRVALHGSAARPRLSVDISCRLGAQQQTRRPPLLMSINVTERRTDRRTDGRTPDRYLDPAAHTMLAVSISIKHRKNNIGFFSIIFVIIWFNFTAAMVGVRVIAYSVYYKNVTVQHSNSYIQQQQQNPFNGPFLGLPG